jgi:hypothetical protein
MIKLFKKKQEAVDPELKRYSMAIIFNNDRMLTYEFTNVRATNAEDAINEMKHFVAHNGHFGNMKPEEVLAKLSAINVQEH